MNHAIKIILYLIVCALFVFSLKSLYKDKSFSQDLKKTAQDESASVGEEAKVLNLYFLDLNQMGNTSCEAGAVVKRKLPEGVNVAEMAATMLVKGLTKEEVQSGYGSAINPKVSVKKIEVVSGVAYLDFDSKLLEKTNELCGFLAIKSQVEKTLRSIDGINKVVISVDGTQKNSF